MRVIIDCDPGNGVPGSNVDDGLAIGLAIAASDRIDLEAITIVAGNTTNRVGYAVAQTMLAEFGVDVPLYLGGDRALVEDPERWRRHLDFGARALERIDNRLTRYLVPTVRPWVSYLDATRNIGGMRIHVVVAVALLLEPSIATSRRSAVSVELAPGLSRGRTARWTPEALNRREDQALAEPPPVDVLVDVDNARLLELLTDVIRSRG